jgi:hypothetical protein
MSLRNVFMFSVATIAILYFWPSQATNAAKRMGDTARAATSAGYEAAKK